MIRCGNYPPVRNARIQRASCGRGASGGAGQGSRYRAGNLYPEQPGRLCVDTLHAETTPELVRVERL